MKNKMNTYAIYTIDYNFVRITRTLKEAKRTLRAMLRMTDNQIGAIIDKVDKNGIKTRIERVYTSNDIEEIEE